jgi:sulfatase modifying factor 1
VRWIGRRLAAGSVGLLLVGVVVREVSAQRTNDQRMDMLTPTVGLRTPPTRAMDAGLRDATAPRDANATALRDGELRDVRSDALSDAPRSNLRCRDGMKLVEGDYCLNVEQRCLRWLDPEEQMRCAEFAPTLCYGRRRRHMAFCMDQYEWPNRRGQLPTVRVTWHDARRMCEQAGKRLCTEREWTFACEGERALPYLYGYQRDNNVCHFDHQTRRPDRGRLANPATAADEYARLYEAVPSGQYDRCVSSFGINDLTGNVDEWTVNESGVPFQSALKGGWWGPIRARCRPATYSHNEVFIYYQIGFRCCSEAQSGDGG